MEAFWKNARDFTGIHALGPDILGTRPESEAQFEGILTLLTVVARWELLTIMDVDTGYQ